MAPIGDLLNKLRTTYFGHEGEWWHPLDENLPGVLVLKLVLLRRPPPAPPYHPTIHKFFSLRFLEILNMDLPSSAIDYR